MWPCCLSSPPVPSALIDSVLVSVHVELDFANEAWLLALSRTPTLPTALASSPSRILTSLSLTTGRGKFYCPCLSAALTPPLGGSGVQREGNKASQVSHPLPSTALFRPALLKPRESLLFPGASARPSSLLPSPRYRPFLSCSTSPSSKLWQSPQGQTVVGWTSLSPPLMTCPVGPRKL